MRGTFGTGPVGTGLYLVGHEGSWVDPHDVDVWMLLLFFPLMPLSRWRVRATAGGDVPPERRALELALLARSRVPVASALRRVLKAAGVVVLTLLPLALAVWKVGTPWGTAVLTALFGSVLSPSLLEKLGMALELGLVLSGAAAPLLVLMHLDELTPRVSLRDALRVTTTE